MKAPSIRRRILLISTLLVAGFVGATAWSLNSAFRERSHAATLEQLQAHIYTLLALTQEGQGGRLRMPKTLPPSLFNQPDSGVYALIVGENGDYIWRSNSLLGRRLPLPGPLPTGMTRQHSLGDLLIFDQAIAWDDLQGRPIPYTLSVAIDTVPLQASRNAFQQTLWLWLGALGLFLLVVQLLAMRWGLHPLQRITRAIHQIELGQAKQLPVDVPLELRPLAEAINGLIKQSRKHQQRIRHSLADLAHSLKTPLTILRGLSNEVGSAQQARVIEEQVSRIDETISYHRQKAAVAGTTPLLPPVAILPVVERLGRGLTRLHTDRTLTLQLELSDDFQLKMEPGDLMELLGNLMDNAFRHARSQVRIRGETAASRLIVEDDGPGMADELKNAVLHRGIRADQQHPGEGIGLAVVSEILGQYDASMRIENSTLGGARFVLTFS